jgi:hypothetical protein
LRALRSHSIKSLDFSPLRFSMPCRRVEPRKRRVD